MAQRLLSMRRIPVESIDLRRSSAHISLAEGETKITSREAGQVRDDWDDERLLAALSEAMAARQAIPSWFVETGKNAYAWHSIDAELAQLTYDSSTGDFSTGQTRCATGRSELAVIRAMNFTSAHLSVELEVTETCLLGQISPPQSGTIETQTGAGATTSTPLDEVGCFAIDPIPASPFRLRCRTADGTDVLTGWITL